MTDSHYSADVQLADIPNFTNSQATILIGEVYGTGHGDK